MAKNFFKLIVSLNDLISYIFLFITKKKNNDQGTPTVAYTSVLMVAIFLRFVKFLESFIIVHISHYSLLVIISCILQSFIY